MRNTPESVWWKLVLCLLASVVSVSASAQQIDASSQIKNTVPMANLPVLASVWSATTTYSSGSIVTYTDGNTYQSLQSGNVNNAPNTATTYWIQLAGTILNPLNITAGLAQGIIDTRSSQAQAVSNLGAQDCQSTPEASTNRFHSGGTVCVEAQPNQCTWGGETYYSKFDCAAESAISIVNTTGQAAVIVAQNGTYQFYDEHEFPQVSAGSVSIVGAGMGAVVTTQMAFLQNNLHRGSATSGSIFQVAATLPTAAISFTNTGTRSHQIFANFGVDNSQGLARNGSMYLPGTEGGSFLNLRLSDESVSNSGMFMLGDKDAAAVTSGYISNGYSADLNISHVYGTRLSTNSATSYSKWTHLMATTSPNSALASGYNCSTLTTTTVSCQFTTSSTAGTITVGDTLLIGDSGSHDTPTWFLPVTFLGVETTRVTGTITATGTNSITATISATTLPTPTSGTLNTILSDGDGAGSIQKVYVVPTSLGTSQITSDTFFNWRGWKGSTSTPCSVAPLGYPLIGAGQVLSATIDPTTVGWNTWTGSKVGDIFTIANSASNNGTGDGTVTVNGIAANIQSVTGFTTTANSSHVTLTVSNGLAYTVGSPITFSDDLRLSGIDNATMLAGNTLLVIANSPTTITVRWSPAKALTASGSASGEVGVLSTASYSTSGLTGVPVSFTANSAPGNGSNYGGTHFIWQQGETPTGTINGTNRVFTLAHSSLLNTPTQVYVNGVLQPETQSVTSYYVNGTTLTMATAPPNGATLTVGYDYIYSDPYTILSTSGAGIISGLKLDVQAMGAMTGVQFLNLAGATVGTGGTACDQLHTYPQVIRPSLGPSAFNIASTSDSVFGDPDFQGDVWDAVYTEYAHGGNIFLRGHAVGLSGALNGFHDYNGNNTFLDWYPDTINGTKLWLDAGAARTNEEIIGQRPLQASAFGPFPGASMFEIGSNTTAGLAVYAGSCNTSGPDDQGGYSQLFNSGSGPVSTTKAAIVSLQGVGECNSSTWPLTIDWTYNGLIVANQGLLLPTVTNATSIGTDGLGNVVPTPLSGLNNYEETTPDFPGGSSTGTATSGSSTVSVTNVTNLVIGNTIQGSGLVSGTTVTGITGTGPYTLTLSTPTISAISGTVGWSTSMQGPGDLMCQNGYSGGVHNCATSIKNGVFSTALGTPQIVSSGTNLAPTGALFHVQAVATNIATISTSSLKYGSGFFDFIADGAFSFVGGAGGESQGIASSGSTSMTVTNISNMSTGQTITGTGLAAGTTISAISGASSPYTVTLSTATTAAVNSTVIWFTNAQTSTAAYISSSSFTTVPGQQYHVVYDGYFFTINPVLLAGAAITGTGQLKGYCSGAAGSIASFSFFGFGSNSLACAAGGNSGAGTVLERNGTLSNLSVRCHLPASSSSYGVFTVNVSVPSNYATATTTGTASSGSTTLTVASGTNIAVGQYVALPLGTTGISSSTTVAAVSGTTVTLSAATTAAVSGTVYFSTMKILTDITTPLTVNLGSVAGDTTVYDTTDTYAALKGSIVRVFGTESGTSGTLGTCTFGMNY